MKTQVHTIQMGDVDEPDIYLHFFLDKWFKTELGSWVVLHSKDITYTRKPDPAHMGWRYCVWADFDKSTHLVYMLKWQGHADKV